ncbi:helix-turn-helix domain-containing protein [Enterococcus wangshanyuanii]|uniref:HTH cro/C1-type domain-containing protein n=1 Tax=Enterococcus wangshanyuanii TaxID=2005703 RepID=A0ABQ1NIG0_9ENTE|nr:helix-turn-helix transcriptional regulator [Enterococcus wangshanyuanii]GGC74525.1 hypothetical protein GCM10011573_00010 [Enterococcus wangshanyuanii]
MNLGDTLKFFRTKKHITQKELLPTHIDPSSYSRIEGNRRPIRLNDLQSIIRNLEIHPDEFFSYVSIDEEQDLFRSIYYYCSTHLTNQKYKKKLLEYYYSLENNTHKDLRELSNYISIKSLFHPHWAEVDGMSSEEVNYVYNLLLNKSYYFQYDYILINNLVPFFNSKQTDILFMKAFPIKDEASRGSYVNTPNKKRRKNCLMLIKNNK